MAYLAHAQEYDFEVLTAYRVGMMQNLQMKVMSADFISNL